MADDPRRAIQDLLLADTSLASMGLSNYRGGLAIFAQKRVPEDAALPYVNVAGLFAGVDFDTKTRGGNEEFYDVVIADKCDISTPPARVDRLARHIQSALHRCRLVITGKNVIRVRALPPIEQESTPGVASLIVQVAVLYQGAPVEWPS